MRRQISILCCNSFFKKCSFFTSGPTVQVSRGSVVSVRVFGGLLDRRVQSFTGVCLFYRKTSGYLGLYVVLGRVPVLLYIPTRGPFLSSVEVH